MKKSEGQEERFTLEKIFVLEGLLSIKNKNTAHVVTGLAVRYNESPRLSLNFNAPKNEFSRSFPSPQ